MSISKLRKNNDQNFLIIRNFLKDLNNECSLSELDFHLKKNQLSLNMILNSKGENLLFEHSWKDFIFNYLIMNININNVNIKGKSPLFMHTYHDLDRLIKSSCDVNIIDLKGENALFYAIKEKEIDKVKKLILAGISINQKNFNNKNAIFSLFDHYDVIVDKNFIKIIDLLHNANNDFNIISNYNMNFFETFFDNLYKYKMIFEKNDDIENFEDIVLKIKPIVKNISSGNPAFEYYKKILGKYSEYEKNILSGKISSSIINPSKNNKRL